MNFISETCRAL